VPNLLHKTYFFIVWTERDIHIERVYPDEEFWSRNMPRVQQFFTTAILPELLGRFHSRNQQPAINLNEPSDCGPVSSSSQSTSAQTYCYCHGPDEGDMVGCDNSSCVHQWFHLECLGLKSMPKTKKWFCPECRKLPEFQMRKKRKIAN